MYLLFDSVYRQFHLNTQAISVIILSILFGAIIGAAVRYKAHVKANHTKHLIFLKGSYFGMIIFGLIFAAHFFAGFMQSVYPVATASGQYETITLIILCVFSALTIGQNGMLYFKYKNACSVALNE